MTNNIEITEMEFLWLWIKAWKNNNLLVGIKALMTQPSIFQF